MRLSGRQIDCIRGGRSVFAGLDFEAFSGEVLAVVGPNGSGKTSLLRLIAGLPGDSSQCLKAVGLGHATHLPAAFLSAGQRRRLSIARLLVVRRPVWLLDEPTSALDTAGQDLFTGVMRDHLASGGIIIAATHTPLGIDARELRMGGAT
jgi:heme exporter protein A